MALTAPDICCRIVSCGKPVPALPNDALVMEAVLLFDRKLFRHRFGEGGFLVAERMLRVELDAAGVVLGQSDVLIRTAVDPDRGLDAISRRLGRRLIAAEIGNDRGIDLGIVRREAAAIAAIGGPR